MANYLYTLNTVEEAPFAWNPLHERFRIPRAISTKETSPGVYVEVRYDSYTNELGAVNIPANWSTDAQFDLPAEGLHYFRGGYEHIVDDTVRTNLINSGVATSANFTLIP